MSKISNGILGKISSCFTEAPFSTRGEGPGLRCLLFILVLASCTAQNKSHHAFQQKSNINNKTFIADTLINNFVSDSVLAHSLLGVCVHDVETKKYIHQYNDNKYFVPASNTKLFTCYAAMKYLGDSLVGLRYESEGNGKVYIYGTSDPTFLHSDFKNQPVFNFLKGKNVVYVDNGYHTRFKPLGDGWAWNDYTESYMPERSELPIYGNCAKFFLQNDTIAVIPRVFNTKNPYTSINENLKGVNTNRFRITRSISDNNFWKLRTYPQENQPIFNHQYIPFATTFPNEVFTFLGHTFIGLLEDTLGQKIEVLPRMVDIVTTFPNIIHSQPTDSLLKITMHRSDNFFAEQTLLMVSNEKLGYMSDEKIIDTLLKTDLKDVPQLPNWVDGSGLSRADLFTPQDFVYILEKMKNEFGLERLKNILPTGNTGTLEGLYKNLNGKIFAKTGTLGNQVALSGYLITKKGKLLIFSVLVNNHMTSASKVRRAMERFVNQLWQSE